MFTPSRTVPNVPSPIFFVSLKSQTLLFKRDGALETSGGIEMISLSIDEEFIYFTISNIFLLF